MAEVGQEESESTRRNEEKTRRLRRQELLRSLVDLFWAVFEERDATDHRCTQNQNGPQKRPDRPDWRGVGGTESAGAETLSEGGWTQQVADPPISSSS
jgi:hypothetical protein